MLFWCVVCTDPARRVGVGGDRKTHEEATKPGQLTVGLCGRQYSRTYFEMTH